MVDFAISWGPSGVAARSRAPPPAATPPRLRDGESAHACCICGTVLRVPEAHRLFRCQCCTTVLELRPSSSVRPAADPVPLVRGEIDAWEAGIDHHRHWQMEDDGAVATLAQRIEACFASIRCLEKCFTEHGSAEEPLDIDVISRFYTLVECDADAQKALFSRLKTLLYRPGLYYEDQADDRPWRWAVMLLLCPMLNSSLLSSSDRRDLSSRLFGLVTSLSSRQQYRICRLWAHHAALCLKPLVSSANSCIAHFLAACREADYKAYMNDWRITVTVKLLSLCFAANQRALEHAHADALPADAFYNVAVDALGARALIQDFELFKRLSKLADGGTAAPFVFCAYPFLLSIGSKMALVSYDNRRHMTASARSALRSTAAGIIESPVLGLRVRRTHVVQDSLQQLFANRDSLRKPVRVSFVGEEGIDAGGLLKEWLLLLTAELFSAKFGMWMHDDESHLCWFDNLSHDKDTEAEFFLCGVAIGIAVYSASPVEIPLPLAVYKMLTKQTANFADLQQLHPALARGLEELLAFDGDVDATFCRTFVTEREIYGERKEFELKPGGKDISVTAQNRQEYVQLLVQHTFGAAKVQYKSFARGFNQVCGGNALSLLSAQELEMLVRGQEPSELDVAQLQTCALLEGWPAPAKDDVTVKLFWRYLGSLKPIEQRNLLAFICGSGRLPATGTLHLRITCGGRDLKRLPISHTCFNQLVLPRHTTFSGLSKALTTATQESSGFGLR